MSLDDSFFGEQQTLESSFANDTRILGINEEDVLISSNTQDSSSSSNVGLILEQNDNSTLNYLEDSSIFPTLLNSSTNPNYADNSAESRGIIGVNNTEPLVGDTDRDFDVDRDDVKVILQGLKTNAIGDNDPRDLNGDGKITILDARRLTITLARNTDKTAPEFSSSLSEDTGIDNSDRITTNPAIIGTITDLNQVTSLQVALSDTDEFTEIIGLVGDDGSFSLTAEDLNTINGSPLADGEYSLQFFAKDQWANKVERELSLTLDTTGPVIDANLTEDTGSDGNDGITNNPSITGKITDDVPLASLKAGFGEATFDITSLVQPDGSFSLDAAKLAEINGNTPLADGDYTLNLIAVDAAGNESTITPFSFTLDTLAPEVTLTEPLANSTITAESQLVGTVNEEGTLSYRFNDGETVDVPVTESSFEQTLDLTGLSEGNNSLTVIATDKAGNVTEETVTVNYTIDPGDITPPVINVDLTSDTGSNSDDGITSNPSITGNVTDDVAVTMLKAGFGDAEVDITSLVQSDGSFALDAAKLAEINGNAALTDGDYTLNLVATDAAGNETTKEISFTLDNTAPLVSITNQLNAEDTIIDLTFDEPVSNQAGNIDNYTLTIVGGDFDGQTVEIASITRFSDTQVRLELTTPLASGNYTLDIAPVVTDIAGNSVDDSQLIELAIIPAPVEISPVNGEEMVALTRETIVRFGKAIDPRTVTEDSFYLIANGERIPGRIVVSSTEEFATFFYDEPLPQSTEVRVVVEGDLIIGRDGIALDADNNTIPGGTATADFRTLPLTQIEGTDVFGYVYDSYNRNPDGSNIPLEGVKITLDSLPNVSATTDENGYFILENVPAPEFYVYIDGSGVEGAPAGTQYASLGKAFHSVPGEAVRLSMDGEEFDIYLPPMAESDVVELSPTEDTDVGFGPASLASLQERFPDIPAEVWARTQVTYPAGSAQNDNGEAATQAMIVPVDPNRLPAPLPSFVDPQLVISIQAGSDQGFNREVEGGATNFDVPAPVQFPNLEGLAPGEKSLIWSFNHDAGDWEVIGTGTVSEDGLVIESDEGVGVRAPGWHFTISGTRSRFEIGRKGGGAGAGNDFLKGDFPIENGSFNPSLIQFLSLTETRLLLFTDGLLESNLRFGLKLFTFGEFDNLADQFVNRFIAGTGGTFTHDVGSSLSDLAKDSDTIQSVIENLEESIDEMIQTQANGGSIDNRELNVTIPNNISFPLSEPSLKGLIGGTQGTTIFIEDFDATATIDSPETGGSGEYSATLRLEILDDFGVDESDLYDGIAPPPYRPLYAFWILQHERIGPAPFINEIIIEVPIEGEFIVPPGFEDVEINISNAISLPQFQISPESLNNEFIVDIQSSQNQITDTETITDSAIPGFGNNPQVFYRYIMESGLELTGTISPDEPIQNFVLPPNQFFTASFYQPSTNSSTSIASVTSPSGEFSLFSDSPGGQGESDSRVNLDTFGGLDSDGDGIPDIGEEVMGTDANNADSDGDGISDAAELEQGLDPLGGEAFPTGIISSLPILGEANSIVVEGSTLESGGQTAYVATGSHGLAIVDASQFNNPIIFGQLDLLGDATDVAVDSNLDIAAVATNSEGLQLVDVSDPMLPTLLQTIKVSANQVGFPVTQVEVFDGIAYITAGSSLRAIDLLTGESLQNLAIPGSGTITGMAREGTKLYTFTSGSDTFSVIDISNQGEASVLGQSNIFIASTDVGVFAGNGIAYLAGSGLRTVDVSNATNPTLISDADFFSTARNVSLNGSGLALVSAEDQGIGIYDLSDPQNTNNILFTLDTPGFARDVAIASGIAFVADDSGGLQVINYLPFDSNEQAPTATINSLLEDSDSNTAGIQIVEGSSVPIQINVVDDVQVRNVELLVNGEVVSNDVSFPYDLSAIALGNDPDAETITVQARATDTGGNTALSELLTLDLIPDTITPTIETIVPGDGQTALENLRRVTISFSEALDSEDIILENFQLLDSANTLIPAEDIQLRAGDSTVQLTYSALPEGDYQLVINASAISDRAGNLLGTENVTSSFTLEPSQFIDISQTGEIVPNLIGDDLSSLIDLPFEFEFYGQTYTQAGISSNGIITLGGTNTEYTNQSLESGGFGLRGLPSILPFWDDLETRSNEGDVATVFTETIGSPGNRQFIIQWHQVEAYPFNSKTGDITFQAIFSEGTNDIQFNYLDVFFEGNTDVVHGEGRSATIGIWNSSEEFQQYSFNETKVRDGLSLILREDGIFES